MTHIRMLWPIGDTVSYTTSGVGVWEPGGSWIAVLVWGFGVFGVRRGHGAGGSRRFVFIFETSGSRSATSQLIVVEDATVGAGMGGSGEWCFCWMRGKRTAVGVGGGTEDWVLYYKVRLWNVTLELRVGRSGGVLWTLQWTFGFHELRGIWRVEELYAFGKALSSMEVAGYIVLHLVFQK